MAQQVIAPQRQPRVGGIKSVLVGGEFTPESRLIVAQGSDGIVWEDAGCGLPSATRAGCYAESGPTGQSEVQSVTITGAPTGGFWVYFFDGIQSGNIAWNANAAAVQAILDALPNVNPGDIIVTGGPGTAYTLTFAGRYATRTIPPTSVSGSLTGGVDPSVDLVVVTPGYPPKVATGPSMYSSIGAPFALYKGVECYIGGDSIGDSYEQQALDILAAGEDRSIEAVLGSWAMSDATTNRPSLVAAVGYAVSLADISYVGRPVLLMNRMDADTAFAEGVLVWRDGMLVTGNGSPVIASGVYPSNVVGVIGQPAVYASEPIARTALEHAENLAMAIAERVYAIGVDCDFRHAVIVVAP